MKVSLVVPPSGFQLDERVYPMLGVLKVAHVLEAAGHEVDVLDLSGVPEADQERLTFQHLYPDDDLDGSVYNFADAYGISATMPQMPAAIKVAGWLRGLTKAPIILGGAHPTLVNAAAKRGVVRSQRMLAQMQEHFDVVVAGDGERAIFEAIKPGAPKLVDADDPKSELFLQPNEIAASKAAWPLRSKINLKSYHHWVDGVPSTSIIAQLGCPFQCGFCGGRYSPTFRRVRVRSTEDIVEEMTHLYEVHGFSGFMFLDDELNVNKAFTDLLRAIRARQRDLGVNWRLCGLLKSELFTREQADLMYAAGFRKLLTGFESGDPRILDNMRKMATVEDNTRCVETAHAAGLQVKALMSLGHPGESHASIMATRDWLLAVQPDEFDATVMTVYPGTPYHDDAVETTPGVWTYTAKNGDRLHATEINQLTDTPYYKGVPGQYESFVWTDYLTRQELVQLRDYVETDVRAKLHIPWPKDAAANQFEHSMGMR